jgi:hypothetical protein
MTDKKASTDNTEAKIATSNVKDTKAKAKVTTKKKGVAMKSSKATKKLKSMKSKPAVNNSKDLKAVRTLCNKLLTSKEAKKLDLTLVENAKGAIQVKRAGALMFSFRKTGRGAIITHPIFTGRGKAKTRWMKHGGSSWDHLTDCLWSEVTLEMLVKRIKDKKNPKDYHDEIYKGKTASKSGLVLKAEAAKKRIAKLQKESNKTKNIKKREKKAVKKAKTTVKRQAKKKPASPVVAKVAKAIV